MQKEREYHCRHFCIYHWRKFVCSGIVAEFRRCRILQGQIHSLKWFPLRSYIFSSHAGFNTQYAIWNTDGWRLACVASLTFNSTLVGITIASTQTKTWHFNMKRNDDHHHWWYNNTYINISIGYSSTSELGLYSNGARCSAEWHSTNTWIGMRHCVGMPATDSPECVYLCAYQQNDKCFVELTIYCIMYINSNTHTHNMPISTFILSIVLKSSIKFNKQALIEEVVLVFLVCYGSERQRQSEITAGGLAEEEKWPWISITGR